MFAFLRLLFGSIDGAEEHAHTRNKVHAKNRKIGFSRNFCSAIYTYSTVVDYGRLPEHHYLSAEDAWKLFGYFSENSLPLPKWLRVPDFYLPSKNLNHIRQEKPNVLEDVAKLQCLADTICLCPTDIKDYTTEQSKKDKNKEDKNKEEIKCMTANLREEPLMRATVPALKLALGKRGVNPTREQNRKLELVMLLRDEMSNFDDTDLTGLLGDILKG